MADHEKETNSSSIVKPLTQLSLSNLVIKKRKKPADQDGETQPNRFAPIKRQRKRASELSRLDIIKKTSNYKSSASYKVRTPFSRLTRSDVTTLQYITYLVDRCIKNGTEQRYGDLREKIHEIECESRYHNHEIIAASRILEKDGLQRIFEEIDLFPWDIKVDAEALYKRWTKGDFDASLLRGIEVEKKAKSTNYKIAEAYKDKKVSAHAIGENGLTNGDWWPMRICAMRDGAHGEREAGIHGKADVGAYSVVLAAGGYADEDNGEIIEYCGTASETPTPTTRTTFLRKSLINKNPIRVLRAASKSRFAPTEGIRYDGLYQIVAEEPLDLSTGMYRFTLKRLPGQDPIRYQGVEARPTRQQLHERAMIRNLISTST